MDVQPRAPEYGARRHHACHEVGDGRLAPLLATARSGGITVSETSLVDSAPSAVAATVSDVVADSAPTTTAPSGPIEAGRLQYLSSPAPSYPAAALRAGQQGTVLLRVLVGTDGRPAEVSVQTSSGHRMLDLAARSQVLRNWRFQPAMQNGQAVQAYGLVPVSFSLN
ncbi:hypothetical protein HZS92_02971 [Xanthomonas citri pv. citri]|nr:hypothetical protein HZS92_02971 [Xanthomonas citri pv. citri]